MGVLHAVQRAAIGHFIAHVIETRQDLIERYDLQNEVLEVLTIWSDTGEETGREFATGVGC